MKKKGKKEKRENSFFYYMKPKNLSSEIRKYGYTYTPLKTVGIYLFLAAAVILIGFIVRLKWLPCMCIILTGIIILPSIISRSYKKMYEQQRFSDLILYMEQMLYSFKRSTRILNALNDTLTVFNDEENHMRRRIIKAINIIETQVDVEEGLKEIEKGYENDRLFQLHRLIMKIERLGGDYSSSITLLLESNKQWADRVSVHQKEVSKQRMVLMAVIGLNVLICSFMLCVFPKEYNITEYPLYQVATALFFIILLFIYAKIDKKMGISWISDEANRPWQETVKMYERVKNRDEKKEKKQSLFYAAIPTAGIIAVAVKILIAGNMKKLDIVLLIVLFFMLLFCLNQHKIGYRLAVKVVTKELEKKFPTWLMEVALRSQMSNIQMAIMGSYENCSKILEPPLRELIANLEQDPLGIEPYNNFLKEFDVPEIHSAMKMFYAISKGNGGDTNEQITELISRNNKLMDKSEEIREEERITSFQSLQYAVMAVGIIKLMSDMVLFILVFFQMSEF